MIDTHAAQQVPTFLAAGGGEDLRPRTPGDGNRGLTHAARGGVDQNFVAGLDPGQVLQCVPGGRGGSGDSRSLIVAQSSRQRHRQVGIAGDERGPAAVRRDAAHVVPDPVGLHPGPTAVTTPAKSLPNCGVPASLGTDPWQPARR